MSEHTKNEALYRGKRHYDKEGNPLGGIKVVVDDSFVVEVEGGEYKICTDAYNSKEILTFKNKTNKQILDHIHNDFSCKFEQSKAESGDFILCRLVVNDKKEKDYKGTVRQILDKMQSEHSCRVSFGNKLMKKGGEISDEEIQKRWDKKKEHIEKLANSIRSLRYNITKDLKGEDEKQRLTALAIAIMDKTAERVGNSDSATNGHFGVTGFNKRHIKVEGDKVYLNYTGKSGVKHEKYFTDEVVAKELKRAVKGSNCEFVFCTEDGFRIKADKINRYLSEYGISAKDIRGYSANRWVIDKLNSIETKDIPETEQKRKRKFNKILKSVAAKVGHGAGTLKKHYLIPEIETEFIVNSKIIELSDFYKKGGKTISQTPAPKTDRIYGSKVNKPDSASSGKSAKEIKLSAETLVSISKKVKQHNLENPNKKITLPIAKAVVRRGMGAYSSTHRPTISGGKPNSRVAWGLARLNAFLYKAKNGVSKSGKYSQDNDLLDELGIKHKVLEQGGSVLLAPNGKPSNLNPEQYKLVRTPEFKAWFGDWENDPANASKVVDENGEPLVVWHFSKRLKIPSDKFYVFNVNRQLGAHFGSIKQTESIPYQPNAEEYNSLTEGEKLRVSRGYYAKTKSPTSFRYYQVFLNIKNPIRAKDTEFWEDDYLVKLLRFKFSNLIDEDFISESAKQLAIKNKIDGIVYLNRFENELPNIDEYDDVGDDELKKIFPALEDSWIAFEPNKIKLADGTNTTFDSSNPDIRFEEGGSVLLAPNGKPSNLTPEQYKLVRTPEFKAWFGDWEKAYESGNYDDVSKVIDEETKEPLVVYHGTTKEFNVFNLKYAKSQTKVDWGELGFFFTPSKELALDFTKYNWASEKSKFRKGSRAIGCFISIKKPKKLLARQFVMSSKSGKEYRDESLKNYDGWIIEKFDDDDKGSWERIFGVGSAEEFLYNQYVTFYPTQIKLADGTNTTFDSRNPDIRYAVGGSVLLAPNGKPSNLTPEQYKLVRTPEFKAWFGDWENDPENASKVVDSNGEPLVVYHGTKEKFFVFDKSKINQEWNYGINGFFFSNFHTAYSYTEYTHTDKNGWKTQRHNKRNVISAFLNLRNPSYDFNKYRRNDNTKDGIIDWQMSYYIAFEPSQIKLADGTNTTFDSSNPDIRFEKGGDINSYNFYSNCVNYPDINDLYCIVDNEFEITKSTFEKKVNSNEWEILKTALGYTRKFPIEKDWYVRYFRSKDINGEKTYHIRHSAIEYIFKKNDSKYQFYYNKDDGFAKGGSVLLAPNGKPSNLNPEQYKLVRTPEFKAWFGDWENDPANASKVLDSNGEPLVCYHGTYVENPFYIFDFEKADLGFHFGTYEQAKNRSETKIFFKGRKSIVNSFFLNIKTIFEVTDIGEWEYPQRYIDMFVSDGLINETDAKKNGFYRLIQREENKHIREYLLNKYGKLVGFMYNNKYEGKGKSFIVLNPNQIKLADGTNTKFDSSNPDIRFADGGTISKKSVFVSIKAPYDLVGKSFERERVYDEKVFSELSRRVLNGVIGVSESSGNISEWFPARDVLIVMEYDEFAKLNEFEKIDYRDADKLLSNNLYLFKRLHQNLNDDYGVKNSLQKILPHVANEVDLFTKVLSGQKYYEAERIYRFLNPNYTSAFYTWIEKENKKIESTSSLTKYILEFNEKDDNYLGYGFKTQHLKYEELYPVVKKGIENAARIFESEAELILKTKKLTIPLNSLLVFKNEGKWERKSNLKELIDKYKLREKYRIKYISPRSLDIVRSKYLQMQQDDFTQKVKMSKDDLEQKKNVVLNELLELTLKKVSDAIDYNCETEWLKFGLGTFRDKDRENNYQWWEIPPLQEIIYRQKEIIKESWNLLFEKSVGKLTIYTFLNCEDLVKIRLNKFKESKEGSYLYSSLRDYVTENNYSVSDWCLEPEIMDYKELAKIYLDKMGYEIYRYYDKKDLVLQPKYAKGGNIKKKNRGGNCYFAAAQFIFGINKPNIKFFGTPYIVHAEVQGQGDISHIRYGHAWVEDDYFVYDYSNDRELVFPKELYYFIGDVNTEDSKKYQRYTFEEAKRKIYENKNYGCWDLDVEYKSGGEIINSKNEKKIVPTAIVEDKINLNTFSNTTKANSFFKKHNLPFFVKKHLGEGTYGKAYLLGNGNVLKITTSQEEAFSSFITRKLQDKLKAQAKVYRIIKILSEDYPDSNLYFIEKEKIDIVMGDFMKTNKTINLIKNLGFDFIIEEMEVSPYSKTPIAFYKEIIDSVTADVLEDVLNHSITEKKAERVLMAIEGAKKEIIELAEMFFEFRKQLKKDNKLLKSEGVAIDDVHAGNYGVARNNKLLCFDCSTHSSVVELLKGGVIGVEKEETYKKWKSLVNMSAGELKKFMDSDEGKAAGLSKEQASKLGIHYGRESAKWIIKMKNTPVEEWTPTMWDWAKRQISFNSRMLGNKGELYDEKGNKTRKHTSLLIWGHNPDKKQQGGIVTEEQAIFKKAENSPFVSLKKIGDDAYVFTELDKFGAEREKKCNLRELKELCKSYF